MSARFPVPPGVIARVVQAAADPDTRIADLTRLLETDAVLSAQVLRSVNSACFGLRQKVGSVERAITIMGTRAVRNLALSMGVRDLVPTTSIGDFPLDVFWEFSLRRASAAQCFAERLALDNKEEFFTLGLCQDIGVLARLRDDAGLAERLTPALREVAEARLAIERQRGEGHDRVGYEMFAAWNFPDELAVPMLHHHDPAGAPAEHRQRASVANAAEAIADLSMVDDRTVAMQAVTERLGTLGLGEEAIAPVVERVNELVHDFAELIGLEIEMQPTAEEIIATASRGLVDLNLSYEDLTRKLEESLAEQRRMGEQLQALNKELGNQARTDSLTAIANRRSLDEALRRELAIAQRQASPLSVLIFDIDHFKRINDSEGHQAGDRVLQALGRILAEEARETDFVARYGGEEFVVVLPFTDRAGGEIAAERYRQVVEKLVIPWENGELRITLSVGGSTLRSIQLPLARVGEVLLGMADEALYRAKQSGRNCVRWNDRDPRSPNACDPTPATATHKTPVA